MKSLKLSVLVISLSLFACEGYMEPVAITGLLTIEQVTENYTFSKGQVTSIYSDLQSEFTRIGSALLACASDEAEFTEETSSIHNFNRGSWNQYYNPDDVWGTLYRNIRKVNQYLLHSDQVNLDNYKYDPAQQAVYQNYLAEIERWTYEVRLIRAYYYFELIRRYGGVPLITEVMSLNDDYSDVKRNTLAECIQFIVVECDATAAELPVRHATSELGRMTKVAALALKSRVLLYAASELFNNPGWASGYLNPELISLTGSRQTRWQAAAEAAKEAIVAAESGANPHVLSANYRDLFGPNAHTNNEVIFFRRDGASNFFELTNVSIGFNGGSSGTCPSQNLVDAYEMKDGSRFDWNNPEHAANPYTNRDPRLALTIVTNSTTFKGRTMECWEGGLDGPPTVRTSKTGYYLKKYVNESLNLETNQTSVHSWIIFRLAELYLNYAEALNEADPGNTEINTYVDKVRQRTGINMPVLPSGLDQAAMRERIYRERQVEFAFEGHRFWDLRRWMIAPSVLATPVKGVKITRASENQFDYSPQEVETRIFTPKMYLYPIPQTEIFIASGLVQNPLW